MLTTITRKKIVAHPYFSLGCVLAVFFILPRFGGVALMVGCAGILTAFVSAQPERFRNRRGSLGLAIGLIIAMWIAAAMVAALAVTGGLHD